MTPTEIKLQERIKELTCLYEVSSIIVNCDYDQLEISLEAIAYCIKKALQYEELAEISLVCGEYDLQTDGFRPGMRAIRTDIRVFNEVKGQIKAGYPKNKKSPPDFLKEELILLQNVSLAVSNLVERKQILDNEAAVKRQMERADRLHILGEITAGIAHELNTPLANILGFAELLKERITDGEGSRDLEKIVDNALFSREIVKNLMFFACKMPQEMQMVKVVPIVENVLELMKPSLREKEIRLVKAFGGKNIQFKADTVQLTQVLFNLIMNALYYSPKGGQIGVGVTEKERAIQIRISDQGPGIAPENADRIFEPFFTTKPTGEGSGLGLSVVHGIISSHKGTITHAPNDSEGTVFTVEFPK